MQRPIQLEGWNKECIEEMWSKEAGKSDILHLEAKAVPYSRIYNTALLGRTGESQDTEACPH